jgi:multiple sugar transport system substrate-binding protein
VSALLRMAVRKFPPFESAVVRQFDAFRRQSNIDATIEIEAFALNPLHKRLLGGNALKNGEIDIAFLPTDWLAQAQERGMIADLNPHLARAPIANFPDGWSQSLVKSQSFAGGFWGMPYHDGPQCLIYRTDLFAQAGLGPPETWDQFVAAARRLHAPEQEQFGTVLALFPDGHNSFYDFCVHVWTRGGAPFDADGRPKLITRQATEALDFLRALARDGSAIAPNPREIDSVRSGLMFCEGKIALMTNWFGFAALGDSIDGPVKGKIDVAPLPASAGGRSISLNVFWMLTLASGSRNGELAWEFMRHAATPAMDRLTTTEGAVGVRRSTWTDPEIDARIPYYSKLEALHERAQEMPRRANLPAFARITDVMLGRALGTSVSSGELLREAQAAIEDVPE